MTSKDNYVYLYDSTLRDGAQTHGVDFSAVDKQDIAREMDKVGFDYIEGGWPGANPTDDAFFASLPKLKQARITAFGMTRRANASAANDPGLNALINTGVKAVCIVGKTWDFHVDAALEIPREENIRMISDSIAHLKSKKVEPLFDAEHFFDGYKANPVYALACIKAAYEAGARWVVLCDTNGGTLPREVEKIVSEVVKYVPGSHLGIHCHDDTSNAVANSIAAVQAGVRQVQGTLNGLGERCGNTNLMTLIPTLMLKLGYETNLGQEGLKQLTRLSRFLDERLNRAPDPYAPYVGSAAFAHKGGLHVSAVAKNPASYEHINPEAVGNARHIVVSDQAGRSNIVARLKEIGLNVDKYPKEKINALVDAIKQRESEGYAYDSADASFDLLAKRLLESVPEYYTLLSFRVIDERRWNAKGELITLSEATIKLKLQTRRVMTVAEGNGPVNALDNALRKALSKRYKPLKEMRLVDYKVRIITPEAGTEALIRVLVVTEDADGHRWTTIGVSTNVIDASYNALHDSIVYKLMKEKVAP